MIQSIRQWLRKTFCRTPKQWALWILGNLLQVPALFLLMFALIEFLPELDFWFKWVVLLIVLVLYSWGTDLIAKGRNK